MPAIGQTAQSPDRMLQSQAVNGGHQPASTIRYLRKEPLYNSTDIFLYYFGLGASNPICRV